MALFPLFLLVLGPVLAPAKPADVRALRARHALVLLVAAFLLSASRQRFLTAYKKDPMRGAVSTLRTLSQSHPALPIVWVGYVRAVTQYGGTQVDAASPNVVAGPPPRVVGGVGWTETLVHDWTQTHPDYFLMLHRPDKYDTATAWHKLVDDNRNAKLVWRERNMRIFRIAPR